MVRVVVSTIVTTGVGKAVREDAALQIFVKRLAHKGLWCVVVALPVELAATSECTPGLEVLGNGAFKKFHYFKYIAHN